MRGSAGRLYVWLDVDSNANITVGARAGALSLFESDDDDDDDYEELSPPHLTAAGVRQMLAGDYFHQQQTGAQIIIYIIIAPIAVVQVPSLETAPDQLH